MNIKPNNGGLGANAAFPAATRWPALFPGRPGQGAGSSCTWSVSRTRLSRWHYSCP